MSRFFIFIFILFGCASENNNSKLLRKLASSSFLVPKNEKIIHFFIDTSYLKDTSSISTNAEILDKKLYKVELNNFSRDTIGYYTSTLFGHSFSTPFTFHRIRDSLFIHSFSTGGIGLGAQFTILNPGQRQIYSVNMSSVYYLYDIDVYQMRVMVSEYYILRNGKKPEEVKCYFLVATSGMRFDIYRTSSELLKPCFKKPCKLDDVIYKE